VEPAVGLVSKWFLADERNNRNRHLTDQLNFSSLMRLWCTHYIWNCECQKVSLFLL